MVHGICRNLYIYDGNSGTAKPIAGTTACFLGRKKELILVINLSNTMANGHLDESMAFRSTQSLRLISKSFLHSALLLLILYFSIDMIGTSCSCSCYSQSCRAISWLDIIFYSSLLQASIEAK